MSATRNITDSTPSGTPSMASAQPRLSYLRRALCGATVLTAAVGAAPVAWAQNLPTGGNVVDGSATISSDAASVAINQTSDRVVIDWDDFDVADGARVDFHQPGAHAWALNRDLSGAASHIDGALSANGNVILQNRHGVHFGTNAQIEVNSIIATTHDIDNADFMAGELTFGIPGESDATVTNAGSITVNDGGLAALVAPAVSNSGAVRARKGTVALAAGETSTYDFYGDGLINIAVSTPTTETPVGPDGQPVDALVANSGAVFADGGSVILTASQLESVVVSAINLDGIVQANSIAEAGGRIALVSDNGAIAVSGAITADGADTDQSGGAIQIAGAAIEIAPTAAVSASGSAGGGYVDIRGDSALLVSGAVTADSAEAVGGDITMTADAMTLTGATISASGATQGGEINLGGEYQGGGALAHAATLTVDDASTVSAVATGDDGAGGSIVLWSTDLTETYGSLRAGPAYGFIEVSSKGVFVSGGDIFAGVGGHVLFDPSEVIFSDHEPVGNGVGGSRVNPQAIEDLLNAGTSVTITADNNIRVAGEIISDRDDVSLILEAGADIQFAFVSESGGRTTALPRIELTGDGSLLEATSNLKVVGQGGRTQTRGGISVAVGLRNVYLEADTIRFTVSDAGDSASLISLLSGTIVARDHLILDVEEPLANTLGVTSDIAVGPFANLTASRLTARAQTLGINFADQVPGGAANSLIDIDTIVEASSLKDIVIVDKDGLEIDGPVSASGEVEFRLGSGALTMGDAADAGIDASKFIIVADSAGTSANRIAYNAATGSDLNINLQGGGFFDLTGGQGGSVNVFGSTTGGLDLLGDSGVAIVIGGGLSVGGTFTVTEIAGMTQTAALTVGTLTGSSYGDIDLSTHDNMIGHLRDFVGLVPTGGAAPALFALRNSRDLNFGRDDPDGGLKGFTTVKLTLEDLAGAERFNFVGIQNFQPRIAAAELTVTARSIVDLLEFAATKDGATLVLDLAAPPDTELDSEINIAVADVTATTPLTVNVYGQVTSNSADPGLILKSDSLVAINVGNGGDGTVGLTVDGTLEISGDAGITQDDPITATRLAFTSIEDVLLSNNLNDVDRLLASRSALGDVTLTDTGDLELDGAVTAAGTLTLNVGGALTDSDGTVVIDGLEVPNPNGGGYLLAPFVNVNAASAGASGAPIRIYARPDSEFLGLDLETSTLDLSPLFDPVVTLGLSGDGFFEFLVTNDAGLPTSLDDLLPTDPDELAKFKADNPELFAFLQTIDFEIGVRRFNVAGTVSNGSDLTLTGGEAPLVFNNTVLDAGDDSVLLGFDAAGLTVDGVLTADDFLAAAVDGAVSADTVDLDLRDALTDGGGSIAASLLKIAAASAGSQADPIAFIVAASDLDLSLSGDGFFDLSGASTADVLGAVAGDLSLDGADAVTVNIGPAGTGLSVGDILTFTDVAAVTQTAGLTAGALTGNAGSVALSLTGANDIDFLEDFSTGNGDFSLIDIDGLELAGLVDAGSGTVTLTLGGDLTASVDGSVLAAVLILTAANAGGPIVYTASGSRLELDLSGDGEFVLDGETTNVHGVVDGSLSLFSEGTAVNVGNGDGGLLEGPDDGALVVGGTFSSDVSALTREDCLFVAGGGGCGPIEIFDMTAPFIADTPTLVLITFGDEAFDATPGDELLTPGDAAFQSSAFTAPTAAGPFDRPYALGSHASAAGQPEETCVSAFFSDVWKVEAACE